MKKRVKKNKFIDTNCVDYNKQPFYEVNRNENSQINLIKNNYNNKEKLQVTLTNNFDPYNYNLNYFDSIKRTYTTENNYTPLFNQEAGRGFGNLNINNEMRKGDSGRIDNDDFKVYRESEVNNRFQFVDDRFNNPRNLVLPFPRLGNPTRKVTNFNTNPDVYTDFDTAFGFLPGSQEMPNATLIDDINKHNILEKEQQINYMNKIKKLKENVYYQGVNYKKTLVAAMSSTEAPSYRFDEIVPDDLRLLGYIPSRSVEEPSFFQFPINNIPSFTDNKKNYFSTEGGKETSEGGEKISEGGEKISEGEGGTVEGEPVEGEGEPVQAEGEPVEGEGEPVEGEGEQVQAEGEGEQVQAEGGTVEGEAEPVQAEEEPALREEQLVQKSTEGGEPKFSMSNEEQIQSLNPPTSNETLNINKKIPNNVFIKGKKVIEAIKKYFGFSQDYELSSNEIESLSKKLPPEFMIDNNTIENSSSSEAPVINSSSNFVQNYYSSEVPVNYYSSEKSSSLESINNIINIPSIGNLVLPSEINKKDLIIKENPQYSYIADILVNDKNKNTEINIVSEKTKINQPIEIGKSEIKIDKNADIDIGSTIIIGTPPNVTIAKVIGVQNNQNSSLNKSIEPFEDTTNYKTLILDIPITKKYLNDTPIVEIETINIKPAIISSSEGVIIKTFVPIDETNKIADMKSSILAPINYASLESSSLESSSLAPINYSSLESSNKVPINYSSLESSNKVPINYSSLEESSSLAPNNYSSLESSSLAPNNYSSLESSNIPPINYSSLESSSLAPNNYSSLESSSLAPNNYSSLESSSLAPINYSGLEESSNIPPINYSSLESSSLAPINYSSLESSNIPPINYSSLEVSSSLAPINYSSLESSNIPPIDYSSLESSNIPPINYSSLESSSLAPINYSSSLESSNIPPIDYSSLEFSSLESSNIPPINYSSLEFSSLESSNIPPIDYSE